MGNNQTPVAPSRSKTRGLRAGLGELALRENRREAASGSAIFSEQAWAEITHSLGLSVRERQIVRAVFDDRTESAIAADLGISVHTVHTHVERLHQKLGLADRVTLVLRVVNEFLKLTRAPGSSMPPICATRAAGQCPSNL